jgi:hypothetical protein
MLSRKLTVDLDKAGMGVSFLCAVHCAVLPLCLNVLPLIGMQFMASSYIETGIVLLSLIIGCTSLGRSWRQHRNPRPVLIMVLGFVVIFTGHFATAHQNEWMLLGLGGLLVATAHFYNWKVNKVCTLVK